MSINLIEIAQEYFSDTVIDKISSSLGFDKDTAGNAIGKIFPSLMGLFGDKAQTPEGATQLFDTIKEADTGILDNLSEAFSGDNTEIIDKGKNVLGSLLGGKLDSLTDIIEKIPGLSGKAGGLMGLLTPILTGMLGKQVKTGGLNPAGLTSLLDDQKGHISDYLGGDFTSKLGLGSFFSGAGAAASCTAGSVGDALGSAKGAACDLAGDAKDAVGGALGSAKGAACAVGGAVTGAAGDAVGAAKDVAGDAVDAVGGAVSGVAGTAKGLAGSAAGAVGSATVAAKGAAGGAAGGAVDAVGGAVSGAAGAVGAGASGAASAGVATAGKAGGGLMKLLPIAGVGLLAFIGFKMCSGGGADGDEGTLSKIKNAAGEATSTVSGAMDDAGVAISDTLGGAVDSAGETMSKAGDAVSDTLGGAVDSAGETMSKAGNAVSDTLGGAVGSAGETMSKVGEEVSDTLGGAVSSTSEAVSGGIELPSFVPTPDAEALSEKATSLAQTLTRIQIPEGADIDALYSKLNTGGDSNFLYRITFATGETGVPEAHQAALKAKLQEADASATLVTIGYADTRGDDALNKKLSYGRAKEVGAWIKSTLGSDTNLESFSMGETDRFSRTEFSKNRVVEIWQIK